MHLKSAFLFTILLYIIFSWISQNSYFPNTYEWFFVSYALFLAQFCCSSPAIHNFTAQGQPQRKAYISEYISQIHTWKVV